MPTYFPQAISYAKGGLVNRNASFNLTDDSFQVLENAYNFRGRIRRRQGFETLGRLRRDIGTTLFGVTDAFGNFTGNLITFFPLEGTSQIAPGSITVTIGAQVFTEPATPDGTLNNGGLGTGTINYDTGAITIDTDPNVVGGAVQIAFSYYPGMPVMGLGIIENATINSESLIAFDTTYSYTYSPATNRFVQIGTATTWQGSNSDFFYTTNILIAGSNTFLQFTTNFNVTAPRDPIRYFNGTIWTNFAPRLDTTPPAPATNFLHQARIIVQYRGRVVVLNTYEGPTLATATNFPQRARWSQIGSPLDAQAWRSDIAGRGSFIDCPISETIVSAEFVRDTLIVGFERSTWKLRYTGNELTPFVWERINRELGCESTFSVVPFDKGVLQIGDKSINICDGNGVEPIDQNIPDEVFQIHNGSDGPLRVQGIRDFYLRQVYWVYPDADLNPTFPNRMFVFDYESQSWAIFTDSFTTLGNWQRNNDLRWIDLPIAWQDANFSWQSATSQSNFPNIVAGNQQGYVVILNQKVANDESLYIDAIASGTDPVQIISPEHNLENNDFVRVRNAIGFGSALNDRTFKINVIDTDTFSLFEYNTTSGFFDSVDIGTGTYLGLGEIEKVMNMKVQSKDFNFIPEGSRGLFGYIDFLADRTSTGEVACEIRVDNQRNDPINLEDPLTPNNFFNTNFTTQENTAFNQDGELLWQRFYCPTSAQFFNFTLTFSDRQMATPAIIDSDVRIEAFIVWLSKDGRLVK